MTSVKATQTEVATRLPGDELVDADVTMDRACSLDAPPEQVWPWVVQLGKQRAGWYFPRPVERLIPPSRRALRHVDPAYTGLAVGDLIPDYGGKHETFTVAAIEAPSYLLYTSTPRPGRA